MSYSSKAAKQISVVSFALNPAETKKINVLQNKKIREI